VFGGTKIDSATSIAVDSTQWVYITGKTTSTDYPVSFFNYPAQFPPMQKSLGGVQDAFVTKLSPTGLLYGGYSTYLGGSDDDEGAGIAVDNSGFANVTGITLSKNFPIVGPTFGFPTGSDSTTFVTKLVPDGTGVLYSTFLGFGTDEGNAIAIAPSGTTYVAGDTNSTAFPTTIGAFQKNKPSPQLLSNGLASFDGFVAAFSYGGLLLSATYLGGPDAPTFPRSIAINNRGEVYVAGDTFSANFPGPSPITPNPTAGFLVKFPSTLASLGFRIYLGAQINSIYVPRPTSPQSVVFLTPTQIYTAGFRFVPGSNVNDPNNVDAFAVKVEDAPVVVSLPLISN
jgi:hypothetical protein